MAASVGVKSGSGNARGVAACVLAAALTITYAPIVGKLVSDWWSDPDYSYAFICVPVAVVMAFRLSRRWAEVPSEPSGWGLAVAVASAALLVAGRLGAELFLSRISLIGFLCGALLFVHGRSMLKTLALPMALLLLAIPLPAVLMTQVTLPLQLFASATTEAVLHLAHIPVFREGNVLMLPNTTLEVAEACSGIRSVTALLTLGLLIAQTVPRRALARATIVVAALPVAVAVNVMRVSITAVAAYTYGEAAAQGAVHETLGWIMFVAGCWLLWMLARLFAGSDSRAALGCAP